MQILYSLVVYLYVGLIRIAALAGAAKARQWVQGRKHWKKSLPSFSPTDAVVWFHCASLGEFEQGRPVLEAMKAEEPTLKVVLTFFSPSGYEIRKNYPLADWVGYLHADVGSNATHFVEAIRPSLAIFVKYDLWLGFLRACSANQVPIILIASNFRHPSILLKAWTRMQYSHLAHVFVQAEENRRLLNNLLPRLPITVAGDPRFDRVASIAKTAAPIPEIEAWLGGAPCLVAGSTWPPDEALLAEVAPWLAAHNWKLIVVPHEVGEGHIKAIEARFSGDSVRWSHLTGPVATASTKPVLIVDTIGLLGRLYRYGRLSYIGGGFGKGIHNTLEAAVWGVPVLFGPNYHRFREAVGLIQAGGGASIRSSKEMLVWLEAAHTASDSFHQAGSAAAAFVQQGSGATATILSVLKSHKLWPGER